MRIALAFALALGSGVLVGSTSSVYAAPGAPWQAYDEKEKDPDIGPAFSAYRLEKPDGSTQRLIVYRLFTAPNYGDLGAMTVQVLKEYYQDASFTRPRAVALCNGISGSSFAYTYDFNHDGHLTFVQEIVAQGTAMYAIVYRRPVNQADDAQAMRAMQTFCPPKVEALPTAPPFVIPDEYAQFSPPASFHLSDRSNAIALGWVKQTGSGTSIVALRRQATPFSSLAPIDALPVLDGFRSNAVLESRARKLCPDKSTEGWYVRIRGDFFGTPVNAEQVLFLQDGTLYSAGYLYPAGAIADSAALASLQSLCPRRPPSKELIALRERGTVGGVAVFEAGGVQLTKTDVVALYRLMFAGATVKTQTVWKNPSEMPAYSSKIAYAGQSDSKEALFWVARGLPVDPKDMSDADRAIVDREQQAAGIAAALDFGKGESLQSFVHSRTPESLTSLANLLLDSIQNASVQTVANSLATQQWIAEHIVTGMDRKAVEAALSERGIAFTSPQGDSSQCSDDFIARWLTQGSYYARACAAPHADVRPVMRVVLRGKFEPGCSFSSNLDVLFNQKDQVLRLKESDPIPDCL